MASFEASFGSLSSTKHGTVVSSILLSAAMTGIFSGNIADVYGRTNAIIVGGVIFGIGAAIEASAQILAMFIIGRVIAGLGEGIFLGTLIVYVCEIAPARRRGPAASTIQFLISVGLASGYFIAYGFARLSKTSFSWRAPLIFQSLVSFC